MKKLSFVLFAMALVVSYTQAQSQNDFYGKWIYQNEGTMEFTISGKTFTSVWTPSWVTYVTPVEENTFEIFSWEKIKNENKDTMKDYPTGYLIGLRHGLGNTTSRLFIHRDKNSMISAYEDRDGYHQELFIKPCQQSDFYGTWKVPRDGGRGIIFTDKIETIILSDLYHREILSWKIIINNDNDTKTNYPTGFLITTKGIDYYPEKIEKREYYLHKNKKSLLQINSWDNTQYNWYFNKTE